MTEGDAAAGAVRETTVFLSHFEDLPDYRQKGKVAYPLDEVLLLMLAAALAGAETVADIARFGRAKLSFLQRFRLFENGTPSHDQLGIILARLDPIAFQRCFVAWTAALTKTSAEVIAIDGKTVRRSYQKKGAEEPIHVVSAFAARQRMVLGQVKVGDKSNEIVAIPALLDLLAIEGAVVTIDAMGCQRDIAQKIIDKKADYILALKGNQGTLRDDVETVRPRAEGGRVQEYVGQPGHDRRRRPRPHRDPDGHRFPRHRLAAGQPPVAGPEVGRHGRERTGNRRQGRNRDALLHHLARPARQRPRTDDPQSLDGRKRPPLGARHDLPRRRVPRANRQRPLQPRHRQAHRPQRAQNRQKQGFPAHAPQSRRLGRKRPRRLHRRMNRSVDSPAVSGDHYFAAALPLSVRAARVQRRLIHHAELRRRRRIAGCVVVLRGARWQSRNAAPRNCCWTKVKSSNLLLSRQAQVLLEGGTHEEPGANV